MPTMAGVQYVTRTTACGTVDTYTLPTNRLSKSWDIRSDYRGGHYFDPDTLRWFGSRNFDTVAPGASVELQTKYPRDDRYRVQIWRESSDGTPEPWIGCRHTTRRAAIACAKATSQAMMEG